MLALDTNVLVRFLVNDDRRQSEQAAELIREAVTKGAPLFIPDIVLAETVWVLGRSYKFTKNEIANVIERILCTKELRFSSPGLIRSALKSYIHGQGGFSDYFIKEQSFAEGCDRVVTFDQALKASDGFVVIDLK